MDTPIGARSNIVDTVAVNRIAPPGSPWFSGVDLGTGFVRPPGRAVSTSVYASYAGMYACRGGVGERECRLWGARVTDGWRGRGCGVRGGRPRHGDGTAGRVRRGGGGPRGRLRGGSRSGLGRRGRCLARRRRGATTFRSG